MRIVLAVLLLAGLAACAAPSPQPAPQPQPDLPPSPLSGSTWNAVEIAARPVLHQATLDVQVDGSVSGKSGCNGFSGTSVADGDTLRFGPLAATKMACPDSQMEQEFRYFSALNATRRYLLQGDTLRLLDANGATVVLYQR